MDENEILNMRHELKKANDSLDYEHFCVTLGTIINDFPFFFNGEDLGKIEFFNKSISVIPDSDDEKDCNKANCNSNNKKSPETSNGLTLKVYI